MKITYYALTEVQVGDGIRKPGDLVPEATLWRRVHTYIEKGEIAPVLVVTLPQNMQKKLQSWEDEQVQIQLELEEAQKIRDQEIIEDAAKEAAKQEPEAPRTEAVVEVVAEDHIEVVTNTK